MSASARPSGRQTRVAPSQPAGGSFCASLGNARQRQPLGQVASLVQSKRLGKQAFTSCWVQTGSAGCAQFLSPNAQGVTLHEPSLAPTVHAWFTAHCLSLVHAIGSYTHTCSLPSGAQLKPPSCSDVHVTSTTWASQLSSAGQSVEVLHAIGLALHSPVTSSTGALAQPAAPDEHAASLTPFSQAEPIGQSPSLVHRTPGSHWPLWGAAVGHADPLAQVGDTVGARSQCSPEAHSLSCVQLCASTLDPADSVSANPQPYATVRIQVHRGIV
jgi:hypothetical protein